MTKRTIVVAIDASEHSMHALNWALHTLIPPSSDTYSLILLHAKLPASSTAGMAGPGYLLSAELLISIERARDREIADLMTKALQLCEEEQVKADTMVVVGDARECICETVEKVKADVLVLGSHGYGALKRMMLGSVSDYCAHHANCPVVVVKNPHTKHHDHHKSEEREHHHHQHDKDLQQEAA